MQNKKHKEDRAEIFQSFDALKGFREYLKVKERVIVRKKNLSQDEFEILDWKIHQLSEGMMVTITHFDKGDYIITEGIISKINLEFDKVIFVVTKRISVHDIIDIEW